MEQNVVTDQIQRFILPAAYSVLPSHLWSTKATALLLAIGMQESRFRMRQQQPVGPARGFWMFEPTGVVAVRHHPRTAVMLLAAASDLCYPSIRTMLPIDVCEALQHNDVLAAVFARCLLWTSITRLPDIGETQHGWQEYIKLWRPGTPRGETWAGFYDEAWKQILA